MGQAPSPAERQIRPSSLSQHLREFAANPHAWTALGRNLIPVVGILCVRVVSGAERLQLLVRGRWKLNGNQCREESHDHSEYQMAFHCGS
jgi:hypothetical protein